MTGLSRAGRIWSKGLFVTGAGIVLIAIALNAFFSLTVLKKQGAEIAQSELSAHESRQGQDRGRGFDYARTKEDVEKFKKRLPGEKKLTRVIGDILSAAKKNGLVILTGDYGAETSREIDISKYTITFPVEGRYPQIKKFIYDVEALRYSLAIEDLTLTSSKALDGSIGLKIRVSVYFL